MAIGQLTQHLLTSVAVLERTSPQVWHRMPLDVSCCSFSSSSISTFLGFWSFYHQLSHPTVQFWSWPHLGLAWRFVLLSRPKEWMNCTISSCFVQFSVLPIALASYVGKHLKIYSVCKCCHQHFPQSLVQKCLIVKYWWPLSHPNTAHNVRFQ